jgi:hypothetical protein
MPWVKPPQIGCNASPRVLCSEVVASVLRWCDSRHFAAVARLWLYALYYQPLQECGLHQKTVPCAALAIVWVGPGAVSTIRAPTLPHGELGGGATELSRLFQLFATQSNRFLCVKLHRSCRINGRVSTETQITSSITSPNMETAAPGSRLRHIKNLTCLM